MFVWFMGCVATLLCIITLYDLEKWSCTKIEYQIWAIATMCGWFGLICFIIALTIAKWIDSTLEDKSVKI